MQAFPTRNPNCSKSEIANPSEAVFAGPETVDRMDAMWIQVSKNGKRSNSLFRRDSEKVLEAQSTFSSKP